MAEIATLVELMQQQMVMQQQQMAELVNRLAPPREGSTVKVAPTPVSIPKFTSFDPTSELWKDYLARFDTFTQANSIPEGKVAQVFLTNQTTSIYKLLSTLASQESTPKMVNDLTMKDIGQYMENQYDPKRFIIRERFKFWSSMQRKPGETIPELAARIRQDATTCDFAAIKDPQDEAMRTRFICSVDNEAILKTFQDE